MNSSYLQDGMNCKSSSWLSEWKAQAMLWQPTPLCWSEVRCPSGRHRSRYVWWRTASRNRKPQSSRASAAVVKLNIYMRK